MILRLDREESIAVPAHVDNLTWGDLYIDGTYCCCTLEDEVREHATRPLDPAKMDAWVRSWKIAERTAIPSGIFAMGLEDSPKFGTDTPTIYRVPGFDLIRVHGGTTIDHTEGCPLVGSVQDRLKGTLHGAKVAQRVGDVQLAAVLELIKDALRAARARKEPVSIQIRNAPAWYVGHGLPVPKAEA